MSNETERNEHTQARELCHWADQMAARIIQERGDLPLYTCASGITPSGTVHIGNFREIITVDLVVRALRSRGKNVRFIYSWDDYDVFRKVPANIPGQETLQQYLRFPITMVPDTTGRDENYARHHEMDVERELPRVGIFPEFLYQASRYRANRYAEGMRKALQNRDLIKWCLNNYRDDAHKMKDDDVYWPVAAFCCNCNKDTTEITGYDGEYGVDYRCTSCGNEAHGDLRTSKEFKLGWRVDWPMRWNEERVVFEPGGKDHISPGGSYDTAKLVSKKIYGWDAPITMKYDFVGLKGIPGKMSSSKGKVISLVDALEVYQPEVLRYIFAINKPDHEFAVSFDLDVITMYEAYDRTERIAWGVDKAKSDDLLLREKRVYALAQVADMPPVMPYQVPFRLLTTLLQTYSGDVDAVIASLGDVKPEQEATLRRRCACAWYWVNECAPDDFKFALRTDGSKADLSAAETNAVRAVRDDVLPVMNDCATDKDLQQKIYDVALANGMDAKALFTPMYHVLVNKDQGPRLASFMRIIGQEKLRQILGVY
ncbi:MAG: lysine--tRNA ligase [Treponemataceae bacterium]|nr:lysine--tRNA ligase [Treponemataceae bacterium]